MGHSPIDLHTHDMLVFFLNLVVGPELAPPVHVDFSLPVLYVELLVVVKSNCCNYFQSRIKIVHVFLALD